VLSRTALAVGLLAVLGTSGGLDWASLRGLVSAWPLSLTAVLVLFVAHLVAASRLCALLRPFGLHLSLLSSFRLGLIGVFFSSLLPGAAGGDLVRMYYATEGNPGRRTEVVTVLLMDRIIGLFGLLAWPILAAPLFPGLIGSLDVLRWLLWSAALVVIGMTVAFFAGLSRPVRTSGLVAGVLRRVPIGGYADKALETVGAYQTRPITLLAAIGISWVAHTLAIATMLIIAAAINPTGFAWQMSLLIPLGFVANAVPLTPGGLGVGETAFNHLFDMAGLRGGAEVLLGWRVITIMTSLLGLVFYLQGRRHVVHAATADRGVSMELARSPSKLSA
jgi:uncharacterized protein (TIRG00374 family)